LNVIVGRSVDIPVHVPNLPDFTGGSAPNYQARFESGLLPVFTKPIEPLQYYLTLAELNRLELKSLYQQLRVNSANLKAAYGNIVPNPSLAFGKSQQGNVPSGPKVTAVFFTLNVAAPITNTNQGNIAIFKATGRQLQYQVPSQKNQIVADVSSAYQNLLAAR